jgi:hypothetical protein
VIKDIFIMVDIKNILAIISSVGGFLPFLVVFFFLRKQPYLHNTIKLSWLLGFLFGLVWILESEMIVHPELFMKWYGITMSGCSLFL